MTGFIELMKERGMMAQVTHEEELISHLAEKPRTAYVGFDPTGDSLHVGHLLPVMGLRKWQQAGHRVVALMGGGTAMIGDPTGKSEMRQMLTEEVIHERALKFKDQLSSLLDFSSPEKGLMVNNRDWLRGLEYIPFLREFGSQFSVNRMLSAECFKSRLEKGLSFLEFNYMILQSYDFYHLNKEYDCTVQMGGDDQWSNMLGGMDLIRRKELGSAYCFTLPLLVNSQGKKMGKTESGAIWLDPSMTAPYDLFQYFRNVDDDMVEKCLFYFTDLSVGDVKGLTADGGKGINEAKTVLAFEITKLLHGEDEALKSKEMAAKLFSGDAAGADAPEIMVPADQMGEEIGILELLHLVKIAPSKGEARRWVQQGGLSIDGKKVDDIKHAVSRFLLSDSKGGTNKAGAKALLSFKNYERINFCSLAAEGHIRDST